MSIDGLKNAQIQLKLYFRYNEKFKYWYNHLPTNRSEDIFEANSKVNEQFAKLWLKEWKIDEAWAVFAEMNEDLQSTANALWMIDFLEFDYRKISDAMLAEPIEE